MGALKLTVFLCGACVMVIELVGSRLFAPYLGTSLFVWTSLIGIILGCLSLGYWAGGIFADRRPEARVLALLILVSGLATAVIALVGDPVLFWIQTTIQDIRVGSVIGTVVLFGIPGVLLGMVSPFAVRLAIERVESTGTTAGSLYALSTVGSIAGTFLAGFFLLSFMSHRAILFAVSLTLIAVSALMAGSRISRVRAGIAAMAVLAGSTLEPFVQSVMGEGFVEAHTAYNRVWIYDAYIDGRPTRVLQLNDSSDSAMFLEDDELVLEYTKFFRLARHFQPDLKDTLMIGGGAYSFAKYLLAEDPASRMDVVEIDPKLTELARRHFRLTDDPRLEIHHEDARTFLNRSDKTYDAIFGDVYKSYSIPFQLATREAMEELAESLKPEGVFVLNVISAAEGPNGKLLRALLASMDPYFPQILVFAAENAEDGTQLQNMVVVAFKQKAKRSFVSPDPAINSLLTRIWVREIPRDVPALTDELAPVERYTNGIVRMADRRNSILKKKMESRS